MRFRRENKPQGRQIRYVDGVLQVVGDKEIPEDTQKENKGKKINFKQIKNTVFCIIFALLVVIMPFFFDRAGVYIAESQNMDTTFLKLWHIDSFGGGSGNRANFLEKVAMNYHKLNPSVFVVVQVLTEEEAVSAINSGDRPDLISFSHHIAENVVPKLQKLNIQTDTREELLECGQKGDDTYAVAYLMSGYCLIGNPEVDERLKETLSVDTAYSFDKGQYNYIAGFKGSYGSIAMMKNTDAKCDLTSCDKDILNKTTYQAYSDFVSNKSAVLLGTARDFYRVKNRVSQGNMEECVYIPLGKFTDLVQYIGVINEASKNQAEAFIEYLCSTYVQKGLKDIGLFSPNKLSLYSDKDYKKYESTLNMPIQSISLFMSKEDKEKLFAKSINAMY